MCCQRNELIRMARSFLGKSEDPSSLLPVEFLVQYMAYFSTPFLPGFSVLCLWFGTFGIKKPIDSRIENQSVM